MMWMDHRAKEETEAVNAIKHSAFRFVGQFFSLPFQM